jgi:hypothetical protein
MGSGLDSLLKDGQPGTVTWQLRGHRTSSSDCGGRQMAVRAVHHLWECGATFSDSQLFGSNRALIGRLVPDQPTLHRDSAGRVDPGLLRRPIPARGPRVARPDRTLSGEAVLLHGELMAGAPSAYVMELGTCWAIVMALTGYYLFVRGWRARTRAVRQGRCRCSLNSGPGMLWRNWPSFQRATTVGPATRCGRPMPWSARSPGWLCSGCWSAACPGPSCGQQTQLWPANGTSFWSDDDGAVSEPGSTWTSR